MALFSKAITSYLSQDKGSGAVAVNEPPGETFLNEVVDLCDAVNHCKRTFTRKKRGGLTKDSADSFERIVTSTFAVLMSHFETFQKRQFAHLIDAYFIFATPDELELAKRLQKVGCELSLQRVLVGAGEYGEVGEIVADALPGWHNSERVNAYFRAIFQDLNLYSNDLIRELDILWQLRHSIVHTGGVISRADAKKVSGLAGYGNRRLGFGEEFMPAIGRRFHIMIETILLQLGNKVTAGYKMGEGETDEDKKSLIYSLVGFSSRRKSWFKHAVGAA